MIHSEFNFGERFRQVRKCLNMRQVELAARLDTKQSKISKIENNNVRGDILFIVNDLCKIAGITVEDFLMAEKVETIVITEDLKKLMKKAHRIDMKLLEKVIDLLVEIKKDAD